MTLLPEGLDYDAMLRLLAAAGIGMAIGLNRDLHGKPTGMRTLGLVCMGAALAAITGIRVEGMAGHPDAMSRVVQGILQGVLAGIGFLGAGVVLRDQDALEVHGLTTAATVWVTAALGIACALASWEIVAFAVVITLALLAAARPLEHFVERRQAAREDAAKASGGGPEAQA